MIHRLVTLTISLLSGISAVLLATSAHADPYKHDGFYLAVELGSAYMGATDDVRYSTWERPNHTVKNVGTGWGLFLGSTTSRRFVIGGALICNDYDETKFKLGGILLQFRPESIPGLNFGGVLGFSGTEDGFGFGASFSTGYDWWIYKGFGLGVAGRITWGSDLDLRNSEDSGRSTVETSAVIPALVIRATYY